MPKDLNINGNTYASVERVAASTTDGDKALYVETPRAVSILISDIPGGHCVTFVDATGERSINIMDGKEGKIGPIGPAGTPGKPGISPIINVSDVVGGHRISITDAEGTKFFDVMDGRLIVKEGSGSAEATIVEIYGKPSTGYSVLLDGAPVTGAVLDELVRSGSTVIGFASFGLSFTLPNNYPKSISEGTVFQYGNAVASRSPETFTVTPTHSFEFLARYNDVDYAIFYKDGKWNGLAVSSFLTLLLTEEDGVPFFSLNDQLVSSWYLSEVLFMAAATNRPVFCYQKDMHFYMEDGSAVRPMQYTPFTFTMSAEGVQTFMCEQNDYKYSVTVESLMGYNPVAEKTNAYKTAESKADDLSFNETGDMLYLMSAGERITQGVRINKNGGVDFTTDATLSLDPETKVLSVQTTDDISENNALPITAAAVYSTVGNIEVLLGTI